jgi:DNA-binding transcriptional regulator YiaG
MATLPLRIARTRKDAVVKDDKEKAAMTPREVHEARKALRLNAVDMATMLGYTGTQRRDQMFQLEMGRKKCREPQRRLFEAYLSGYRPPDWPARAGTPDYERFLDDWNLKVG